MLSLKNFLSCNTLAVTLVASTVCTSTLASAADGEAKAKADAGPRKDPDGVRGISPFWEAINKGDSSYIARDFDTAILRFREAISVSPQDSMGHYRMAEAHIAKNQLSDASNALDSAMRFAVDETLKAKLLFLQADLKERERNYAGATEKWTAYETFSKAKPDATTYPATAPDRKKKIEEWKALQKAYGEVKQRVEKRATEAAKALS